MAKKCLVSVLVFFFSTLSQAEAQQPVKMPRIGYLAGNPLPKGSPRTEALRQGLRELGYEEGKTIIIEWRSAEGKFDRLPALAAELVNLKVDVIVSQGPISTRPAKNATTTIPIVMGFDNDPVGSGVVASLARPGGNVTGLSSHAPEISGKQLEILKEIVPGVTRVAVFGNNDEPGNAQNLKEVELAAKGLGVKTQYVSVASAREIEPAFQEARKGRTEALLVLQNPVLIRQRAQVIELAVKYKLPAISIWPRSMIAKWPVTSKIGGCKRCGLLPSKESAQLPVCALASTPKL